MKLRIKGDSLRLRITPSEMRKLVESGRVEETIHFGQAADAKLTYALERGAVAEIEVQYQQGEVIVIAPLAQVQAWASGPEDGIYGGVEIGAGKLEVAIEKDWACLDRKGEDADTFPNPNEDAKC